MLLMCFSCPKNVRQSASTCACISKKFHIWLNSEFGSNFQCRIIDNVALVNNTVTHTVQRMSWYLMSIMTMLEVPVAMLISISRIPFVLERLEGERKRFGAIIIDTLESPIRLVFLFWVIFNSNSNKTWK